MHQPSITVERPGGRVRPGSQNTLQIPHTNVIDKIH